LIVAQIGELVGGRDDVEGKFLIYDREENDEWERARGVAGEDEFTEPNFTGRQRPNTRNTRKRLNACASSFCFSSPLCHSRPAMPNTPAISHQPSIEKITLDHQPRSLGACPNTLWLTDL